MVYRAAKATGRLSAGGGQSPGGGLRVLHVSQAPGGGVAEHIRLLNRHLVAAGHEVTVAGPPDSPLERDAGAPVEFVPIVGFRRLPDPRSDFAALRFLADLFSSRDWDVIHLHSSKAGFIGRLAARWVGVGAVVLYTPHCFAFLADLEGRVNGRWMGTKGLFRLLEQVCRPLGDGVILVSRWEYVEAERAGVIDPRRAWIILNGADPERRGDGPEDLGGGAGPEATSPRVPVIGTITRLQRQKGVDGFLLMAAEVSRSIEARFVIVGDGPDRPMLESLAAELGIADRCEFTGATPDVAPYLRSFDLFVLSSRWESMPLALMEAMAAGLPIVATRVGGVPEVVRDGRSALLVEAGDWSAMGAAVDRLLREPGLAARMGAAAADDYRRRFTPRAFAVETESLYLRLRSRRAGWGRGGRLVSKA